MTVCIINVTLCMVIVLVQFVDQYLSLSTILPGTESLYGLGEHKGPLKLKKLVVGLMLHYIMCYICRDQTYTMWNFDASTPADVNLCK